MKTCSKCQKEFPASTEYFYTTKNNKLRNLCKPCTYKRKTSRIAETRKKIASAPVPGPVDVQIVGRTIITTKRDGSRVIEFLQNIRHAPRSREYSMRGYQSGLAYIRD